MPFFGLTFLDNTADFEEAVTSEERVEGMDPRGRGLDGTFVCCTFARSTESASSSRGLKRSLRELRRIFMKASSLLEFVQITCWTSDSCVVARGQNLKLRACRRWRSGGATSAPLYLVEPVYHARLTTMLCDYKEADS